MKNTFLKNTFLLTALVLSQLASNLSLANEDEPIKAKEPVGNATAVSDANAPTPLVAVPSKTLTAPAGATAVQLLVYPEEIELTTKRDFQSFIAQLVYSNGVTIDVSEQVRATIADPKVLSLSDEGRLVPLADGKTSVTVSLDKFSVEVPVNVNNAGVKPPLSFTNDVMPVFSKAGCNSGSCHGAARGKDGFRLSLYGFDTNGDYHRITREMLGRRINLAVPEECLLVNKATGDVTHTGGKLFGKESSYYATLMEWLRTGAQNDPGKIPSVEKIEVFPKRGLLNGEGSTQQLTVRAHYSDGTNRDVTDLAYFMSSNDNAAVVSQEGLLTAKNRGESFVMARFDTHTVGVDFITLPKDMEFTWNEVENFNYIDNHIHNKLRKLRIQPSEICTDAEFIRRASLDIAGVVPTPDEIRAFSDNPSPDKREQLVDQLLAKKEFVDVWVMKWSELLQIRSSVQVSYKATLLYYTWLQQQIANEVPINEMVQSLLGSQGGTFSNPATNYYQNEQDRLKTAENVAQVFLGMRIQCAQCHNHPFDRWTMKDYYQFAAFFAQVVRKPGQDPREQIVFNRGQGETKHPVTQQNMPPKFLGGEVPDVKGKDRRAVLAEWMTAPDNPFFARNLANIVWAHFFGRGIVHEVDDVRVSNPPVNPELLDELATKFVEYKYDFKKIVRDICTSRTYQLSTKTNPTNESDLTNFSHASLRRIRAEILLDVVSQITETKNKFRGLPLGARAVQIADGNTSNYFLTTFGRASRETVCSCEVKMEPNLSQALHLLNGESVNQKIKQGGVVKRMLDSGVSPMEVVNELYLRCLARQPTLKETEQLAAELDASENKQQLLEDLFWALLNSREFVFNH